MSTEFHLYDVAEKDLYKNKTKEEKEIIRTEMVKYASLHGIKPTARKYNTYPKTVRKWVQKAKENNLEIVK